MDSQGIYRGLDADICRAIGAAVFGDASKVRFIPRFLAARLPSLQSGQIDVWPAPPPGRRTAIRRYGLNFTAVTFYDGLGLPGAPFRRRAACAGPRRRDHLRHRRAAPAS